MSERVVELCVHISYCPCGALTSPPVKAYFFPTTECVVTSLLLEPEFHFLVLRSVRKLSFVGTILFRGALPLSVS